MITIKRFDYKKGQINYMKSKILFLLPILVGISCEVSQAQSCILSTGGETSNNSGTVSYSIGQTVFNNYYNENLSLIEGIQQPYQISIILKSEEPNENIKLKAYPNPSTDHITLKVTGHELRGLAYLFYNSLGQVLATDLISEEETIIYTKDLSPASYFLVVTDKKSIIKTFKILKK
ncbi:T9SS type A sorting domain-containing protein [Echinicola sp. 20G]|uniref:T9SS type A sorting domain-containing protein n=1 Tax=Echinicola sp. 20G TaxID=2781961 RepID=UPI0019111D81|nr:T9SS type A sorting domain-containing protein [Echinicola sp. 20G]